MRLSPVPPSFRPAPYQGAGFFSTRPFLPPSTPPILLRDRAGDFLSSPPDKGARHGLSTVWVALSLY